MNDPKHHQQNQTTPIPKDLEAFFSSMSQQSAWNNDEPIWERMIRELPSDPDPQSIRDRFLFSGDGE